MIYDNIPVNKILFADAREGLKRLPENSVHMVVTSPPYYGQREYHSDIYPVWGGNSDCNHIWGELLDVSDTLRFRPGKGSTVGNDINPEIRPGKAGRGGCFCMECGAWRGELGLEPMLELYVSHLVEVLKEVYRVLRPDGVMFLNLGDSYAGGGHGGHIDNKAVCGVSGPSYIKSSNGLKDTDLCGVPWRVAFALQGFSVVSSESLDRAIRCLLDGNSTGAMDALQGYANNMTTMDNPMWLRQDNIWAKKNSMPESTETRCTKSHEYIFMLTKSQKYYFDYFAIKEDAISYSEDVVEVQEPIRRLIKGEAQIDGQEQHHSANIITRSMRRKRSVWELPTKGYGGAHFAVFPESLPEIAIKAGSPDKVCSECGTPYHRIIEKDETNAVDEDRIREFAAKGIPRTTANLWGSKTKYVDERCVGWEPGCNCDAPVTKPLILDPFMGAGTTAMVAHRADKYYIGFDTNQGFIQQGNDRVGPLTFEELAKR